MAEFSDIIRPTETRAWVGPKDGRGSGLQGAHLIGDDLWRRKLEFLDKLNQFGISRNSISNGTLLPETQRGGAVLGVSVHNGRQLGPMTLFNGTTREIPPDQDSNLFEPSRYSLCGGRSRASRSAARARPRGKYLSAILSSRISIRISSIGQVIKTRSA